MSSAKSVRFFSSITTKITAILVLAFTIIIALVFYTVNLDGFDQVRTESDKLVIQNGENAVKLMSSNLASAMRSASQLRDSSEIVPLEPIAFERALNQVFNQNSYPLLGSGGIWPDAYRLDPDNESAPMTRMRQLQHYVKGNSTQTDGNYLNTPWFNMVKDIKPTSCIWEHIKLTLEDKGFSMRCALAVNRENELWGAVSVNFTLDSIQMAIDSLQGQLGSGYAILIDNSNQIIASTSPKRLPYINKTTGEMMHLDEFAKVHPEWQPIEALVAQTRRQAITRIVKQLPRQTVNQLNAYDEAQGSVSGSMLINAAAALQRDNPQLLKPNPAYISSHVFEDEHLPNNYATAYLFEVPETLWKLVIIKPTNEVHTIADNLGKSVIRYLIFALILTAATAYLLFDTLLLRPLQKTTSRAGVARQLLANHKYDKLSSVKFEETRQDEVGFINATLNECLKHIQYAEAELDEANQRLDMGEDNYLAHLKRKLQPEGVESKTSVSSAIESSAIDSSTIKPAAAESNNTEPNHQQYRSSLSEKLAAKKLLLEAKTKGNDSKNTGSKGTDPKNTTSKNTAPQIKEQYKQPDFLSTTDSDLSKASPEAAKSPFLQSSLISPTIKNLQAAENKKHSKQNTKAKPARRFKKWTKNLRKRWFK